MSEDYKEVYYEEVCDYEGLEDLELESGIRILRNKEPYLALIDERGWVAACLWTSFEGMEFGFDIIVGFGDQEKGLGTRLAKVAIEEWEMMQEAFPEATLHLEVVNHRMGRILNRCGMEMKGDGTWGLS